MTDEAWAGNKRAGLGLRTTEEDWAIDQQRYNEEGQWVSLDPRYDSSMNDGFAGKRRILLCIFTIE
ncbi:MAG: hypothetical protein V7629_07060 [Motiliproteus sp.]